MLSSKVHTGKVAIVRGFSKDTEIGAAIATALAKEDANVSDIGPESVPNILSRISRSRPKLQDRDSL